jgi:hypothetical protein
VEKSSQSLVVFIVSGLMAAAVSGCNQLPGEPSIGSVPIDSGTSTGVPANNTGGGSNTVPLPIPTPTRTPTPVPTVTPTPVPTVTPPSATQCVSTDANHMCIGLKLVTYKDSSGTPTVNSAAAVTLVNGINKIWSACNIAFQMEQYDPVDPTTVGMSYGSGSENELTSIRQQYSDQTTMLVTVTGPWTGKTIAWTAMPGGGPFGTIVDSQYGQNPMTVGHELGHYMGLYHISDSSNLMNPYIGSDTSALNTSQCNTARQTNTSYWQRMLRH